MRLHLAKPAAALAVLGLLAPACGGDDTDDTAAEATTTVADSGTATDATDSPAGTDDDTDDTAAEGGSAVTIADFAFAPDALTVPVGTTVTWTNEDSATHTSSADDGAWDTGSLATGATGEHTFDEVGTFTYHCNIHSTMTGTVTVEA